MCKYKPFRLLCLSFVLICCFLNFGLGVSAASDGNLISPDITTWTDVSNLLDNTFPTTVTSASGIYRVTLSDQDYPVYMGARLDHTSLVAGHSYSLSFKMPSRSEVNTAFDKTYSDSVFNNHFENTEIRIGIAFITPSGDVNFPDDCVLFHITNDNYTKHFGKSLSASFVASNYSGTPIVIIHLTSLDGANHSFYFSDFKLVDNDDNSEELTGIKGFLHSIRWDLVGGVCEEEDCPHSSSGNPHLSLAERLTSGFSSMFQDIGSKFEEGSTLNTWFTNLANKVGNLDGSLSNLGDRINGFFSGLGDRISGFFSNLGDRMSVFFTNLGTSIGGFFSDLKTNMSNWFSELGNKITTKFQEIGDKFTEFFEKFKPRVTINFNWQQGWANPDNGELITDYYKPGQFYEQGFGYCFITDFFEVPSDCTYKMDFVTNNNQFMVIKYDLSGNYIENFKTTWSSFEGLELESGYKYIFQIRFQNNYPSDLEMDDTCNSILSVYADEGWINALLYNLKMGIRGLFVPDEQVITDLKADFDNLLSEHLGIIYTCTDLFTEFLSKAFDIIFEAPDNYSIHIPDVSFEAAGTTVPVFSAQSIDFSFMEKPIFKTIYSMYKVALYIFFGGLEVKYALRTYRKVINN